VGQAYKNSWFNGVPVIVSRSSDSEQRRNAKRRRGSSVHNVVHGNMQPGASSMQDEIKTTISYHQ
jgi:hypothetical protein